MARWGRDGKKWQGGGGMVRAGKVEGEGYKNYLLLKISVAEPEPFDADPQSACDF